MTHFNDVIELDALFDKYPLSSICSRIEGEFLKKLQQDEKGYKILIDISRKIPGYYISNEQNVKQFRQCRYETTKMMEEMIKLYVSNNMTRNVLLNIFLDMLIYIGKNTTDLRKGLEG